MASIHRINAIIAYVDRSVSNYTSADDGIVQRFSLTDVDQTEAELFSWPSFRTFMESIDSLNLNDPIDISHVADIVWSVDMENDTGRRVISGFEAKGGAGTNSNTPYDPNTFPSVDTDIQDRVSAAATATATMRPTGVPVTVARGFGYTNLSELTVLGGTFTSQAILTVSLLSTVLGQDEFDYGGGELNGTFTGGSGYNPSDTITLNDGTVVTVAAVGTAGDVVQFDITTISTSGSANFSTLTQSSTSGSGTGFSLTQRNLNQGVFAANLKQVSEVPIGEYTVIPSDPVSTTSAGASGATFNLDWGVRNVAVVDGGKGYTSVPAVSFAGGSGTTATAAITGDAVTSVTVIAAGSGYSARATVTIAAPPL